MQTEILKMSDEELWNDIYSLFEFERSPEGLRHYKIWNELKKRLSKNNIENKKLNWDGWKDPKKEAEKSVEEFIFRIKNYMEKHDKIGLTYTEISNFDYFEKMSKEELEDIENGKFNN